MAVCQGAYGAKRDALGVHRHRALDAPFASRPIDGSSYSTYSLVRSYRNTRMECRIDLRVCLSVSKAAAVALSFVF